MTDRTKVVRHYTLTVAYFVDEEGTHEDWHDGELDEVLFGCMRELEHELERQAVVYHDIDLEASVNHAAHNGL